MWKSDTKAWRWILDRAMLTRRLRLQHGSRQRSSGHTCWLVSPVLLVASWIRGIDWHSENTSRDNREAHVVAGSGSTESQCNTRRDQIGLLRSQHYLSPLCNETWTDHHACNKSFPPSQADSNETCAVGPLTGVESVLCDERLAAWSSSVETRYSPPTNSY